MAAEWYYTTNKQQMGPVSWDELRELADVGILKPHDMVWSEGMDEWVKAINQSGLFSDGDAEVTATPKKKTSYSEPKPPPGRRTRKRDDEEDDEEDEKEAKRKARKREEERAKMGIGFRVFLGIGAVVGLLLLGTCTCGGLAYLTWGGKDVAKAAPGPNPAPPPVVVGPVHDRFTWNNLNANFHNEKSYNFTAGKRVIITVTNNLANRNTNIDLMVFRGNEQDQNRSLHWDRRPPAVDINCRLDFVVPANDIYRIRVANFGPGMANSCIVTVDEQ